MRKNKEDRRLIVALTSVARPDADSRLARAFQLILAAALRQAAPSDSEGARWENRA